MREKLARIKLLLLDVDGTMTDGGVYILDDGRQFKKFDAQDGMGIKLAIKAGIEVGIISHSGSSDMIYTRAKMVGIQHIYVGQEEKNDILRDWCERYNWKKDEIAFIGDDVNDLGIMSEVGFAACPSNAVSEVKDFVDLVLSKGGGEGSIREFVDIHLLPAKQTIEKA
ncbi:MAG: HAD-IIIA family hydrolase [bacterium]|nr:HAD-IIIA family hydrolase [bacterium]